jgi:hypothetical protein
MCDNLATNLKFPPDEFTGTIGDSLCLERLRSESGTNTRRGMKSNMGVLMNIILGIVGAIVAWLPHRVLLGAPGSS